MSRDNDRAQELFAEMLGAVCRDTGLREDLAMPYVAAAFSFLQATYGGQRLYFPAPERRYDLLQMKTELAQGRSHRQVARAHGISRGTLQRLLDEAVVLKKTKIEPLEKKTRAT